MHADIADIRFFFKLAVDPKYCLLAVDLFSFKTYIYPIKSRHPLAQKKKQNFSIKIFSQKGSRLQKMKG